MSLTTLLFLLVPVVNISVVAGGFASVGLRRGAKHALLDADSVTQAHAVRICNAYAGDGSFLVSHATKVGEKEMAEALGNLPYKSCKDFDVRMRRGDRFSFTAASASEPGIFAVSAVPRDKAVMLLIAQRRSPRSGSMVFQSHVYSETDEAQVAVIDTCQDCQQDRAFLQERSSNQTLLSSELLEFGSVASVLPGRYEVSLQSVDMKEVSTKRADVQQARNYVVFRVGGGANRTSEVVVFPSGAVPASSQLSMLFLFAVSCLHTAFSSTPSW